MKANIVESIGYTVERIHSGLLGHLFLNDADQYEWLRKRVLQMLCEEVEPTDIGTAVHEWNHIDLVLTSSDRKTPIVAFEFKVDSPEGRVRGKPQMEAYRERLGGKVPLIYVTLGLSGVYKKSDTVCYKWIDLNDLWSRPRSSSLPHRPIRSSGGAGCPLSTRIRAAQVGMGAAPCSLAQGCGCIRH